MPKQKYVSRLHSNNPDDAAWRAQQAQVDADIEGLARNPETERLLAEMTAEGASTQQKIERIKAYYVANKVRKSEVA